MPNSAIVGRLADISPRALGELKAWLEPWMRATHIAGGVSVTQKRIIVGWAGGVPSTAINGLTWRIPYDPKDDSSLTFTLNRAFLRIESTATSAVQVRIETSPGGNSPFVPTTFASLTVGAGSYEHDSTGLSGSISSGSLIRIVFTAVPGTVLTFQVQVSGVTS